MMYPESRIENKQVILATELILQRLRDRIQDMFDSFKITTIWWSGNGETSALDVVYGLFGFKMKYLLGIIPWRKKTLLFVINPKLKFVDSSAVHGAYLYHAEIRKVAKEEFDNYCRIVGNTELKFFDLSEVVMQNEKKISDIREKFAVLPLPEDSPSPLIESKVEQLARLKQEVDLNNHKISELEAELGLEDSLEQKFAAIGK